MRKVPWVDRFWTKVDIRGEDECWPWTAATTKGYGRIGGDMIGRKQPKLSAPRCVYFLTHGIWPVVARHTCDNPPCCNPRHIIDGDTRANALDASDRKRQANQQKTHCPQDHEYTPENTARYTAGSRSGRPYRVCKTCRRAASAAQRARKRAAA